MQDRFKFRIPMFTDKETFQEFQYIELGEQIEYTLCGYNGEPQQCTGLKDKNDKLIYEGDIVSDDCGEWIIKYCDKCKSYQCFDNTFGCFACLRDYSWFEFIDNLNDIVIKGNMYENPELLGGANANV